MNERYSHGRAVWGILGGMGPLASAEFLKTIYEQSACSTEQQAPIVVLLSDPTVPDRTHALLNGEEESLFQHFYYRMEQLISFGVTGIVVCCVTIHLLLPRLPLAWRQKVISLVDVIFETVLQTRRRHLLLCTQATNRLGIFQNHRLWRSSNGRIVLLDQEDQRKLHHLIYDVKAGDRNAAHLLLIEQLLDKYQVESYIAGCTEVHMIAKYREGLGGPPRNQLCIDPLTIIASMIASDNYVDQVS